MVYTTPNGGAGAALWEGQQLKVERRFKSQAEAFDHAEVSKRVCSPVTCTPQPLILISLVAMEPASQRAACGTFP